MEPATATSGGSGAEGLVADGPVPSGARAGVAKVLMGISWGAIALGLVVGFNQLATQSPIDAVLPVALFSVGIAGVTTMFAGTIDPFEPRGIERGLLEPPAAEEAFLGFGVALAAIASVGWQWGTAAQAALVGACGAHQILVAELGVMGLLRQRPPEPDALRIGLSGAVGILFVAFAWTALTDAGIAPFG